MARDFLGWSKWSPHVGNAVTIATGVPTVIGGITWLWAYLAPSQGLAPALDGLAAFMMTLWCCIGFLWLRERGRHPRTSAPGTSLDASWGLLIDGVRFNRNIDDPNAECQVTVIFRNALEFPIKMEVFDELLVLDERVPDIKLEGNKFPAVIHKQPITRNFPMYGKGKLPNKERIEGTLSFKARYGHPDTDFTRIATRNYRLLMIRPKPPFGPPPDSFTVMLHIGPLEQDKDDPYVRTG